MDCCNFLPYRHQYYGSQSYYDAFPYPHEYYGGHNYQDYYQPYYHQQQQWQCSNQFTDYVYNPKEARIRKAMREASRERAMGITLPSPRGGTRRGNVGNNPWNFSGEDQMMMGPHGVRMMNSPMCTSPGFNSMSNTSNGGGFMPPIHYTKHLHPMSHHSSQNFMQNNSPRIPQQPEIWHPYEEMRSNSTGPYIISPPHQMHGYQQHLETTFRAKPKTEVDVFPSQEHHHQTIPSNCERQEIEKITMREPVFENKLDSIQPLETEGVENESYVGFGEGNFENKEETKPKKVKSTSGESLKPKKALPDFNEAFGSTERGRFQRPPNNKGFLDYFMQTENDLKFLDFQL